MRRPLGQSVVLASFGVAAMVGSTYYLVAEDEAHINADMELMLQTTWRPDTRITSNDSAVTDAGTPIALHEPVSARGEAEINSIEKHIVSDMRFSGLLIRIAPPTDTHNCHGWVFTGGKYWLGPDDVQRILADNKYERVSEPRTGDIVIYRQGNNITHTAIVRSPAANGRPILVEGKWGWMGVYLHAIDDSSYGKCHEFYRSPRDGHLLVGLGGHSNDVDRRSDRPIPQTPSGN
jgi:hypothetical protein